MNTTQSARPLYLSEADVTRLLPPAVILQVVTATLRATAAGRVVEAAKTGFSLDDEHGVRFMGCAPAGLLDAGVAGVKWFATCADNTRRGLPRVPATIVLCDSTTGLLRGIVDATALTAWRTAALAIAAIRPCVSQPDKATVIGLGAIGQALVHYLATDLGVRRIAVVGRDLERTRRDAAALARTLSVQIDPFDSVEHAVKDADIVITATGLKQDAPFLLADWIKPGATVCGLGSYQEIDESVVARARRIFLDSPKDCAHRGNLAPLFKAGRLPADRISGTVAELTAGTVPAGRISADDIVLIALIGLGTLDIALAARAIERTGQDG
jgi:ornithine cyclodeaminase/alanine dehydrogenase-like protein (mu-crystallin family)